MVILLVSVATVSLIAAFRIAGARNEATRNAQEALEAKEKESALRKLAEDKAEESRQRLALNNDPGKVTQTIQEKIIAAASGLQFPVLEFDAYAGDMFDAIRVSYTYATNTLGARR